MTFAKCSYCLFRMVSPISRKKKQRKAHSVIALLAQE